MCAHPTAAKNADEYTQTLFLPTTVMPMRPAAQPTDHTTPFMGPLGPNNGYTPHPQPVFVLHDGPPYANGHLHPGHALNKVIKDMVCRSQEALGAPAGFRPGWDCHGLPVEWNVEREWAQQGRDKNADVVAFRQACRAYAQGWVDTQRRSFLDLGVRADWSHPYRTMDHRAQTAVAAAFLAMVERDLVYTAQRPMMWSGVEHTVLAEAEVEHLPFKSPAAWVLYPVTAGPLTNPTYPHTDTKTGPDTDHASPTPHPSLLVWTTTPWTLTVSQAVAYGDLSYGLYVASDTGTGWLHEGQHLVLADAQHAGAQKAVRATLVRVGDVLPTALAHTRVQHPLARTHPHWHTELPCCYGAHVRADSGSGLVHTAPAHGPEDFTLAQAYGLKAENALTPTAHLRPDMPVFGGLAVYDGLVSGPASAAVLDALRAAGTLAGRSTYTHSTAHSWRSRAPVVYLMTPQWYLGLDRPLNGSTLRQRALAALDTVRWTPDSGRTRMRGMLTDRPDWVLSRQRSWGVPLPLFVRTHDGLHPDGTTALAGAVLHDDAVNARVLEVFAQEGADAWYAPGAKERFLDGLHDPDAYTACTDVLDVWFESGCVHRFGGPQDQPSPQRADMVVEGTDQHRGWFQSSLLCALALGEQAPFATVVTHGFVLDAKGRKMSKSVGNTLDPAELRATYGLDSLRVWVAMSDTTQDLRLGADSLNTARALTRKLRNTLRYLLGVLHDHRHAHSARCFAPNGHTPPTTPPPPTSPLGPLEHGLLDALHRANATVVEAYAQQHFARALTTAHAFCAETLSAFYCEVRKDALYCDPQHSPERQGALYALSLCFDAVLSWLAPTTVLLVQEAGRLRYQTDPRPVFLDLSAWAHPKAAALMDTLAALRADLHKAQEATGTKPGHALVDLAMPTSVHQHPALADDTFLATALQVAGVERHVDTGYTLQVTGTAPCSCPRCWRGQHTPSLCPRCARMAAHAPDTP